MTTDAKGATPTQSSGMPADPAETPGPKYEVQPRTGGEDDMNAAGKYLLISVPQFAKDPISGNLMTSYLRLGASSSTWEQDPGGWLAAKIHEHGPPGEHLTPDGQEVITPAEVRDTDHVFIDDDRNRVSGVPHDLSKADRVAQSRVIHTRGGWRDHSDGNRITTTYGDKIEVVRGNYKKIVLGRQDEATASAGWDVSGQIIQDFAYMMPGASVRVEESSNYTDADGNNVWHLQNTMENLVQSTNSAGDFFDYKWGKKHWTTTGSPNPVEKGPNSYPRQNPHILEKTWAEHIESYTGSADWYIPLVEETSFITNTVSTETIGTSTSVSTVGVSTSVETVGVSTSTSTIGTQTSIETVDIVTATSTIGTETTSSTVTTSESMERIGTTNSVAIIGAETSVAVKGVSADVTVVGAAADVTVAGIHAELELAILHASIEVCPFALDFFLGMKATIQLGAFLDIKLGPRKDINSVEELRTTITKIENAILYKVVGGLIQLG